MKLLGSLRLCVSDLARSLKLAQETNLAHAKVCWYFIFPPVIFDNWSLGMSHHVLFDVLKEEKDTVTCLSPFKFNLHKEKMTPAQGYIITSFLGQLGMAIHILC